MEEKLKQLLKYFKVNESTISSFLGGLVVILIGVMIFRYFSSINRGSITEVAPVEISDNNSGVIVKEPVLIKEDSGMVPEGLPTTYKVQKGDSLWTIAEKFYTSGYNYVDIIKENKVVNPSKIEVGDEFTIPKVAVKEVVLAKTTVKNVKTALTSLPSIEGNSYKVSDGDSLWKIALRAYGDGFAWIKIYQANKTLVGNNPSRLFVGLDLSIPR